MDASETRSILLEAAKKVDEEVNSDSFDKVLDSVCKFADLPDVLTPSEEASGKNAEDPV